MLLKHNNLVIRNATTEDAAQLALWWNDGKIMAHAGFPHGVGVAAEEIADSLKEDSDDAGRTLIIEIDSIAVGEMGYSNIGDRTAEIGIKICDFLMQNKGYGKILLSMLIRSLFDDMGYQKIVLDTNLKNERAQHVYERLGFRKLRVNENSWEDQDGVPQSSVDYELVREDFVNFAE